MERLLIGCGVGKSVSSPTPPQDLIAEMKFKNTDARRAAAKLLRMARQLGKWQVRESLHVSRRDNNKLFEAEMHMVETARRVAAEYDEAQT